MGALIALFERAVGLYASLVGINAYHQPGVEAGKKAAASVLEVRKAVRSYLLGKKGEALTAEQVAQETGFSDKTGWVFKILENLAVNEPNSFERASEGLPFDAGFRAIESKTFAGFLGGVGFPVGLGAGGLDAMRAARPRS